MDFDARMLVLSENIALVMDYFNEIMGAQTDLVELTERVTGGKDLSAMMDLMGWITRVEPAFAALARTIRELKKG